MEETTINDLTLTTTTNDLAGITFDMTAPQQVFEGDDKDKRRRRRRRNNDNGDDYDGEMDTTPFPIVSLIEGVEVQRYSWFLGPYRIRFRVSNKSADLSRIDSQAGLGFLLNHDHNQFVGRVLTGVIGEDDVGRRQLEHDVSPAPEPFAQDIARSIRSGHRAGVSVGVDPLDIELIEQVDEDDERGNLYEMTSYELIEISSTPIPAFKDVGVQYNWGGEGSAMFGVKESNAEAELIASKFGNKNGGKFNKQRGAGMAPEPTVMERSADTLKIVNHARENGYADVANESIANGETFGDYTNRIAVEEAMVARKLAEQSSEMAHKSVSGIQAEVTDLSEWKASAETAMQELRDENEELRKAVLHQTQAHQPGGGFKRSLTQELATRGDRFDVGRYLAFKSGHPSANLKEGDVAVEIEQVDELAQRRAPEGMPGFNPLAPNSHSIPLNALVPQGFGPEQAQRVYDKIGGEFVVGASDAGEAIGVTGASDLWIPYLYAMTGVLPYCDVRAGLTDDVEYPRMATDMSGGYSTGNDETRPSDTDLNITGLSLTPKQNSIRTSITRLSQLQTRGRHGSEVQRSLAMAFASKLEGGVIEGFTNGPTGAYGGIPTGQKVDRAAATAITAAEWLSPITKVMAANPPMRGQDGSGIYTVTPKIWGLGVQTALISGVNAMIEPAGMNMAMTAGGIPVLWTNHLTATGAAMFGVWSEMVVGVWDYLQIVVNPYNSANSSAIEISAFLWSDAAPAHTAMFEATQD